MTNYDILIIGSGLGGLLSAHILSKEGYRVCVVEKHKQIGGCLQTFKRHGCIFDTGVHYVGSLDQGQLTHQFFSYFNLIDRIKLKRMDADGFDQIHFNESSFRYPMGYERLNEALLERFPEEKSAILGFSEKMQTVVDSLDLFHLRIPKTTVSLNPYFSINFNDYLNQITANQSLIDIFAGLNFLHAGTTQSTSLYLHATVFHSFICSAWRLVDGSSQMADTLAEDIRDQGGTIISNNGVSEIHIKSGKVESVELASGDRLTADQFISNAHPSATLRLIDPQHLKKPYWKRIDKLPNTISTFTVYACLEKDRYPYENHNTYRIKSNSLWNNRKRSSETWPEGYMFLTPAHSESETHASCAIIMTFMDYEEVAKWEGTEIGKRGDAYEAFKQRKAEQLLDAVENDRPGFRQCIKKIYTSTPLTYKDYTGTKEGSIYGISRDCNDPIRSYIPTRTKIPNLYLTGQNIGMHGVLGVTVGAVQTCAEFLGLEYLIRKIRAAS